MGNCKQGNFALILSPSSLLKTYFVEWDLNAYPEYFNKKLLHATGLCKQWLYYYRDELIFQASVCITQIRQGLFAKGWPCFLAGLLGDAVPDSPGLMQRCSAGMFRGPEGQPRGESRASGCGTAARKPGLSRLHQGFFSEYLRWVGNNYPQAWVCILLVMQA